ncbi:NAD/NADP dependent alcohol dehydrogenase [Chamberlinius hualienensis]
MSTEGKIITCKAAVIFQFNSNIKIEKINVAPPPPEHVRVKMVACSLCHSDLSLLEGYLPKQPLPYVPGHEGAGIVESVGEGVTSVKKGDKVFTLCLPRCYQCPTCKGGRSTYCLDYKRKSPPPGPFLRIDNLDGTNSFSLASTGETVYNSFGTSSFAEYTVIPENSCVKVHSNAPLEKACIMACAFPTGFGASVNAVDIKPGETVAVWGMGGVGLSCVLGCKDKNAGKIIGIDLTDEKKSIAFQFGCTDYIALKNIDQGSLPQKIREIHPFGVDFAFVCIGNMSALEEACQSIGLGGTVVLVGVPKESDTAKITPLPILANQRIIGTIIGDYDVHRGIPALVERYLKGDFKIDSLITSTTTLDKINDAVDNMKQGKGLRTVITF